jgi:polyisoprenoid-binding protein YceI
MRLHKRLTRTLPAAIAAFAAVAIFATFAIAAAQTAPVALKVSADSRLWFEGTSTVRDWNCQAGQLDAVIDADAGAPAAVLNGRKAVRTVLLTVPVAQLDCNDNNTMNGHMWKALESSRHATIQFALASYELVQSPTRGTLTGTLTLHGVALPVTIPVEFADVEGALKVTGSYALKMTNWGVEPPKLMFGAMKVGETVTVRFELLLQH